MTRILDKAQWRSGSEVADFLDRFFRQRGWIVNPTTPSEERRLHLGDRHFQKPATHYLVEYKSGIQTAYTGNVFLETISVDSQNIPGWVYTCKADFILYAILPLCKILVFEPLFLRERIKSLKQRYKEVKTAHTQNEGYDTHGLLVPLDYAEKHLAKQVIVFEVFP